MATKGNTALNEGIPEIKDAFVVIVKTEWNAHIVNELESGAKKILQQSNIKYNVLTVPGAIEIPFAIKNMLQANNLLLMHSSLWGLLSVAIRRISIMYAN